MKRSFYLIFILLAIIILGSGIFLFVSFKKAKYDIHNAIFNRMINEVSSLSNNYKEEVIKLLPKNKNWYEYLNKHPDIQKHLEYDLSLFSTKNIQYVYLLGKKGNKYLFLADGSKKDKAEFGEIFEPSNKKEFEILKPHYFFHKKIKSIYLTYVNPIIIDGKLKALIVMDLPLSFSQFVKSVLENLTQKIYIILLFSFIFFVVVICFAYFDFKREKEKEELLRKLQEANKNLANKVQEKVNELRQKDIVIMNQGKLVALGEMLNMIAHQWRQPLNALSAAAIHLELKMEMGRVDKDEVIKFTQFVQEETQRLSKTIDDFMNFSRPDEKKEEFYLTDVINDVIKMIKVQLQNHDIDIEVDIPKDFKIKSYKKVIGHILLNLISNARDALDASNIENKKIIITAKEDEDGIEIIVYDNAGPILDDIKDRVFEPYFTTKEQGKGTGLGLYMSKKLSEEKLKGELYFRNKKDGVEFILKLRRENEL